MIPMERAAGADGKGQKRMTVDVVIPVYKPGKRFGELLGRLAVQTKPAGRLIIVNTEKEYWDAWVAGGGGDFLPDNVSVSHVTRETFDHGGTRDMAVRMSEADICVLMTDDALPAKKTLIEELCRPLEEQPQAAASYARQLPGKSCGPIERYTRGFNYPAVSRVKTKADLEELGIKTFFCSNVCAAYRRDVYLKLGGFVRKTIFNEDMLFAAKAIENGYAVCYAAGAEVIHSHRYTLAQQFKRNFDLAVSQADHPEVFAGIRSEGEGIRLVGQTAAWLIKSGRPYLLPKLVADSGAKYAGYWLGKRYRRLPRRLILCCTMNRNYWNSIKTGGRGQNPVKGYEQDV